MTGQTRDRHTPLCASSFALDDMMGRWSADLIKASGNLSHQRPDRWQQPRLQCRNVKKVLARREASIDAQRHGGPGDAGATEPWREPVQRRALCVPRRPCWPHEIALA